MGKVATAAIVLLIATIVLLQTELVGNVARANFVPAPAIEITSPKPYFVTTYHNSTLTLTIEARVLDTSSPEIFTPNIISISYSLDGKANVTHTDFQKSERQYFAPGQEGIALWITTSLPNLSEGNHTLIAYALDTNGGFLKTNVTFTVSTNSAQNTLQPRSYQPTPTPAIPEFSSLIIVPLLLSALLVAVIVGRRRVSKHTAK